MTAAVRSLMLCAVALLGVAAAVAQPLPGRPPGPPGPFRVQLGDGPLGDGPGMVLPLMLHAGDLTAEQDEKVRAIMQGDRTRLRALFSQIDQANDALAAKLVGSAPVDVAALTPEVERIAALRSELLKQGLQSALAIRAVLTPEQLERAAKKRTRLLALQKEMRALMEE